MQAALGSHSMDSSLTTTPANRSGRAGFPSAQGRTPCGEYYADKIESLRDLFGTRAVTLSSDGLVVDGRRYPILDDVIVLLDPSQYPGQPTDPQTARIVPGAAGPFARDIQHTFGAEWTAFPTVTQDDARTFRQYFDLLPRGAMRDWRVCDLGCGNGRWGHFLYQHCRELLLLDFSESIFVARRNLRAASNALFFMADLTRLPFREDFADLIVCLGVLHHLPTPALEEVRSLRRFARRLLIYVYYALDNRPRYFQWLLRIVTTLRLGLSRSVRHAGARAVLTWALAGGVYLPLVGLGHLLKPIGREHLVPLYETYAGKSLRAIRQDVYDRFFTRIEQRHRRDEILQLAVAFSRLAISENPPYWHFYAER